MKGSSVIRMLSGHLGTQTFLDGVAAYLKSHAYGNATTNDLWAALSKASGKNITEFMVSIFQIILLGRKSLVNLQDIVISEDVETPSS